MGWFSKSEPDAIDHLCVSLRERWWEWTERKRDQFTVLTHLSGTNIAYGSYNPYTCILNVHIGQAAGTQLDNSSSRRLLAAYQDHLAAKVNAKKADLGITAKALAQAVLSGEVDAARGLADWIIENVNGGGQ